MIGLSAGTGAAFSLLPPQNASGNWIKVVQRVPVKIALDPKELAKHPLRIGLSTTTMVDTRDRSGTVLAAEPVSDVHENTTSYAQDMAAAKAAADADHPRQFRPRAEPAMAEAAAKPLPPGEYPPLRGSALVLLSIAIGVSSFMEILDMTIVNVSIPAIAGSMGVSPSEGTWSISSYLLAAAVVQPLAGWIGRRFGEVRTFVISNLLFIVFSMLCGLATSMPMLIAARLMQGLVSGPMMSVAQAILLRNYPVHLRGLALGLWAMVVIVAPIVGPVLGGWITDNYLLALAVLHQRARGPAPRPASAGCCCATANRMRVKVPIDAVGLALLVIGVGALQFMLDNGNEKDWFHSTEIVTAAVIGVVAITVPDSLGTDRQASHRRPAPVPAAQFPRRHHLASRSPTSRSRAST